MLWSTLSNALVKWTNEARTEPPWSRVLHQEWRIQTNAWAVERCFKPPNWFGSRIGARKSQSQSAMNDSRIFPRTGSNEIGLRSEEIVFGGWTFGAGITIADFQTSGTVPSLTDALNTAVSGSAMSVAKYRSFQLGMKSRPVALWTFMLLLRSLFVTGPILYHAAQGPTRANYRPRG